MAAQKQSDIRRELELKHSRQIRRLDLIASTLHTLIPWSALVAITWLFAGAVKTLSGQTTFADIGFKVLTDVRVSDAVGYILGGGGLMYGYKQRKLLQETIQRQSSRISQFEQKQDPERTSSRLTTKGTTRPEDETR